jgi:hypothetical protein
MSEASTKDKKSLLSAIVEDYITKWGYIDVDNIEDPHVRTSVANIISERKIRYEQDLKLSIRLNTRSP